MMIELSTVINEIGSLLLAHSLVLHVRKLVHCKNSVIA